MLKAERLLIYPLLAVLCWTVFGDFGLGRSAQADEPAAVGRFSKVVTQELVVARKNGSPAAGAVATEEGGAFYVLNAKGKDAAELSARDGFGFVGLWAPPVERARIEIFAGARGGHARYPAHMRIFDGAVYIANGAKSHETVLVPGLVELRKDGKVLRRVPATK